MSDQSQEDRFKDERIEKALRTALRRQNPSEEFAPRLLTRIEKRTQPEHTARSWWIFPRPGWAVAGVMCLAITIVSVKYEQHRREAEGQAARRQVLVALRIAGAKIQLAQSRVQQLSQH
jgi:hypothetical protein